MHTYWSHQPFFFCVSDTHLKPSMALEQRPLQVQRLPSSLPSGHILQLQTLGEGHLSNCFFCAHAAFFRVFGRLCKLYSRGSCDKLRLDTNLFLLMFQSWMEQRPEDCDDTCALRRLCEKKWRDTRRNFTYSTISWKSTLFAKDDQTHAYIISGSQIRLQISTCLRQKYSCL